VKSIDESNMEKLRQGVRKSLSKWEQITDPQLRDKVVEAWALALSQTEFRRIEDIPLREALAIGSFSEARKPITFVR
jgi:hypothetical protein